MMKSQVALLYVLIIMSEGSAQSLKPRRSVSFSDVNLKLFKEPDFDGLSSMLVREDIGLLFIGARGKVITLSLDDITEKTGETNWMASSEDKIECQRKGKSIEECDNYIRMMHTLDDGRILACGTKAFEPTCTHLMVNEGHITMENTTHSGKGKIPFDPEENFASMMNGWCNTFYPRPNDVSLSVSVLPGLDSSCLMFLCKLVWTPYVVCPVWTVTVLDQTAGVHREMSSYEMFSCSPTSPWSYVYLDLHEISTSEPALFLLPRLHSHLDASKP
ncbi:semaphorin-4E-like [Poecilia latipinna]|uniref:semaphorin-4E-like n=1 Tax=Poecilia latipinna TaxID=48699 RepID=UPI00072DB328|nr:PREDICTED: semaphorin-4E-like [Poecilia latipinna]XP_014882764.1 PREDICTED: semaphorin-4E-like [Poecilia latipinna]